MYPAVFSTVSNTGREFLTNDKARWNAVYDSVIDRLLKQGVSVNVADAGGLTSTLAAGMVLLVAMIGAIVLSLLHKPVVRRQVIMDQVLRTPATGMRMVSPKPGEGIDA